jgi:hypothetical protein
MHPPTHLKQAPALRARPSHPPSPILPPPPPKTAARAVRYEDQRLPAGQPPLHPLPCAQARLTGLPHARASVTAPSGGGAGSGGAAAPLRRNSSSSTAPPGGGWAGGGGGWGGGGRGPRTVREAEEFDFRGEWVREWCVWVSVGVGVSRDQNQITVGSLCLTAAPNPFFLFTDGARRSLLYSATFGPRFITHGPVNIQRFLCTVPAPPAPAVSYARTGWVATAAANNRHS